MTPCSPHSPLPRHRKRFLRTVHSKLAQLQPSASPPPAVHVPNFTNTQPLLRRRPRFCPGQDRESPEGCGTTPERLGKRRRPGPRQAQRLSRLPPRLLSNPAAAAPCAAQRRSPERPPSRGPPHPAGPERRRAPSRTPPWPQLPTLPFPFSRTHRTAAARERHTPRGEADPFPGHAPQRHTPTRLAAMAT